MVQAAGAPAAAAPVVVVANKGKGKGKGKGGLAEIGGTGNLHSTRGSAAHENSIVQ